MKWILFIIFVFQVSIGKQSVSTSTENIPKYSRDKTKPSIVRIPKCCQPNEVINEDAVCVRKNKSIATTIKAMIEPFGFNVEIYSISKPCGLLIQYENVIFRKDGSLRADNETIMNNFCIDIYDDNLIVLGYDTIPPRYVIMTLISTLCFIFSATYCILISENKNCPHNRCYAGFSFSMACTYISLVYLNSRCSVCSLAYIFEVFMISSNIWVAMWTLEVFLMIRSSSHRMNKQRIKVYYGVNYSFSVIFASISKALSDQPDVPNTYFFKKCQFIEKENLLIFYLPVALCLIISLILLLLSKRQLKHKEKHERNVIWDDIKMENKLRYRKLIFLEILMAYWIISIIYDTFGSYPFHPRVEELLGPVVVTLFCERSKCESVIGTVKKWCKKRKHKTIETKLVLYHVSKTVDENKSVISKKTSVHH